jgi:alpha-1,6-mannosyltransferase
MDGPRGLDADGVATAGDGLELHLPRARPAAVAATASILGIVLVVAAADHSPFPASSPIDAPGRWGPALAVGLALAFAGYLGGIVALRRQALPLVTVLAVAAVIQLAPLAGPTLLSTDAWTYWMYGRIGAELGGNPYGAPPSAYAADVAYTAMGSSWRETTSLYGPVFTLESELGASLAGEQPDRAALFFRLVAALAALGTAALAASIALRPAFAAAFVGWNPLVALHFGGGGHNDALMMLLVVGALVLAARHRPDLAGVAWIGAIGVKWVAAAFLGLWLLDRARRREPLGLLGLAGGTLALVAVATARYGTTWVEAFGGLSSQARRTGSIGLSNWLGDAGLGHRTILVTIGVATLCAFAWLAVAAWRGRCRLGVAGSVTALGQGWLNPWYAGWGVSLSATEEDRLAWALAVGLTAFLLLDVVPR